MLRERVKRIDVLYALPNGGTEPRFYVAALHVTPDALGEWLTSPVMSEFPVACSCRNKEFADLIVELWNNNVANIESYDPTGLGAMKTEGRG